MVKERKYETPKEPFQSEKTYTRYEENLEFFDRWKSSRFWVFRAIYVVAASVWAVVMVVGGFIAWLISVLFI